MTSRHASPLSQPGLPSSFPSERQRIRSIAGIARACHKTISCIRSYAWCIHSPNWRSPIELWNACRIAALDGGHPLHPGQRQYPSAMLPPLLHTMARGAYTTSGYASSSYRVSRVSLADNDWNGNRLRCAVRTAADSGPSRRKVRTTLPWASAIPSAPKVRLCDNGHNCA